MNTRRRGRAHGRASRAYRGRPPARTEAGSSNSGLRIVLLATVLVLVAVVGYVLLSRGPSTTTAACLGATPGEQGVRDSSLRKALRDAPAPIEVLHYTARDAYGKSIEIVLARASDEPAATRIVNRVSPINAVATRTGRVAILSAKPLNPDVRAKIDGCLAKSSWS